MPSLPIESALPALRAALGESTRVVLQAPPGAGKTTRVPLALLDEPWLAGRKIVMLEPRRLAARAAARRMSATLGQSVGETVGFRVRGELRVSMTTRIEVVTEGVLARMLITDPSIDNIGAVLLDEFHERSLQADLALALLLQSQEILRPDLRIVVMSATLDGARLRDFLGAQLVSSEGRAFPVDMQYITRRSETRVEDAVARTVLTSLEQNQGSILAFLPGAAEIHRCLSILESSALPRAVSVIPLFGALAGAEQDLAIATPAPGHRKVVLATSIAESSLTIDGVTVVVDGGLSRIPKFSPRTGMSSLATVRVSRASADQRTGRAGRTAAGVCYRLWDRHEDLQLLDRSRPEILEADLATLALDLAVAGITDPAELRWLDPPPAAALSQARALLRQLGALDDAHRITDHGRAISAVPAHPRIAHMLVTARAAGLGGTACAVAALLGERDILRRDAMHADADLRTRVHFCSPARAGEIIDFSTTLVDRDALRRVRDEMNRLRDTLRIDKSERADDTRTGEVLALAYPDRVAKQRDRESRTYLFRNGSGGALTDAGSLANAEFLAIADVDGSAGHSRIYLAAPIAEADVRSLFASDIERAEILEWNATSGTIKTAMRESLGAIILSESASRQINPDAAADLLVDVIRRENGLSLPWNESATGISQRVLFLRARRADWPDLSEAALMEDLEWLRPHLVGLRKRSDVERLALADIFLGMLTWDQRRLLDSLAPQHWLAPTGTNARIDYSNANAPVIRIRLQEVFGVAETPRVDGIPLTFELLSPAQRPVQVTRDLAGFWKTSYFDVRRDLRGRYPKHFWPEDPTVAEPTRRVRHPKAR